MDFDVRYFNERGEPDINGLVFVAFHWVEVAGTSNVIENAWVRGNADFGSASATIFFDEKQGKGISNTGKVWLGLQNSIDYWPEGGIAKLAPKCRQIRIEGKRESAKTLVSFGLLAQAKA